MRFSKKNVVMATVLLASTFVWGQQPLTDRPASLLVRMSFASSWVPSGFGSFPQICFSVDRSGHYEMRRVTLKVSTEPLHGLPDASSPDDTKRVVKTPQAELLQGTLPPSELAKLEKLLQDPEFLKLTSAPASILRKGAETFVAEVPRETSVQRVVVSDANGENPFPHSAQGIVNWLEHFKAEGAEPLDVSALDICPSGVLQPANPNIALLQSVPATGACITR
jgi:hypothetical protein